MLCCTSGFLKKSIIVLKVLTVILGVTSTVLGWGAVVTISSDSCGENEQGSCPKGILARLIFFAAVSTITLLLSTVSTFLGCINKNKDKSKNKGIRTADATYQLIGGTMLCIASVVVFTYPFDASAEDLDHDDRGGLLILWWFFLSLFMPILLAAVVLGFINSLFYFVTAGILFFCGKSG